MAITNSERVGKALELLKDGLRPYIERELKATYKDRWVETARPSFPDWQQSGKDGKGLNWDTQALLPVMCELWQDCFKKDPRPVGSQPGVWSSGMCVNRMGPPVKAQLLDG